MPTTSVSRRTFVKQSAAVGAAAMAANMSLLGSRAYAAGSQEIRIGVVGCGGRGTGAANDALRAAEGVKVVALGDLFPDRINQCRQGLSQHGERFTATDDDCFTGFDAYKKVINHPQVNYVILATPPGFRPRHYRETVEAGKHCFYEKPVATDAVGVREFIAAGKLAKEKGLGGVNGTIYRRQNNYVEAIKAIHDGAIGQLTGGFGYYMTGALWSVAPQPDRTDMENQCRNWLYYTWLSGDHIAEQAVHNIDALCWIYGNPISAYATGGRITRTEPLFGHIYDHFSIEYAFPNDVRLQMSSRQIANTDTRVANYVIGSKGVANVDPGVSNVQTFDGDVIYRGRRAGNPYVQEHTDLINSIRDGEPINDSQEAAETTLAAIIGRESAYSGRVVNFEWMLNESQLKLVPDDWAFGDAPPAEVARPGRYQLV